MEPAAKRPRFEDLFGEPAPSAVQLASVVPPAYAGTQRELVTRLSDEQISFLTTQLAEYTEQSRERVLVRIFDLSNDSPEHARWILLALVQSLGRLRHVTVRIKDLTTIPEYSDQFNLVIQRFAIALSPVTSGILEHNLVGAIAMCLFAITWLTPARKGAASSIAWLFEDAWLPLIWITKLYAHVMLPCRRPGVLQASAFQNMTRYYPRNGPLVLSHKLIDSLCHVIECALAGVLTAEMLRNLLTTTFPTTWVAPHTVEGLLSAVRGLYVLHRYTISTGELLDQIDSKVAVAFAACGPVV